MIGKKLMLLCFILFFGNSGNLFAQEIEWQKNFGGNSYDYGRAIQQTTDGGFVMAGYSSSSNGDVTGSHGLADYWVVKLDSTGNILWQKCLGGTANDHGHAIQQTTDGGYIVVGKTLSNNGDVSGNHGDWDYWVVKLDGAGNIQWQKCFGGSGTDEANSIHPTADGGFIVAGTTGSNDGDVNGNHGSMDFWVVKIIGAGNIQWQKCFGGTGDDEGYSIEQTTDGGYIVGGNTTSNDGDVSGNHGGFGANDAWVFKIDVGGNIQWQKCLGGTNLDESNEIHQTADGGYIVANRTYSNDGDVSGNNGGYDIWIVKLDVAGNLQWQNCLGGASSEKAFSIQQTDDGGYVLAGYTIFSHDGDVSGNHGKWDFWVVKIDGAGYLDWQKCLGGEETDWAYCVQQTNDGGFIVAGYTQSKHVDLTGNQGNEDYWVVKLTNRFNFVTGKIYLDSNINNVQETGEPDIVNRKVVESNTGKIGFSGFNGQYSVSLLDSGNFSLAADPQNLYNTSPLTQNIYFNSIQQIDSLNDFAFQPTGNYDDLCITITPTGNFRSGFAASYLINYSNQGTTTLNATVVFYPDSNVSFVSSLPSATTITLDSVVFSIGNITPLQTGQILVTVNVNLGLPIGTVINSGVMILPVIGDVNPACNTAYMEAITTGATDPNDILVNRSFLYDYEILNQTELDYIIRFQNTGNDTAFTVKVMNNISDKFDLNSFELISSSHPLAITYHPHSGLFTFTFDNILLPDSNANEPLSHGFIRYKIKPKTNLMVGDSITNQAHIYFDFNDPVATNIAKTDIFLFTGNQEPENSSNSFVLYPNPARTVLNIQFQHNLQNNNSLELYSAFGQKLQTFEIRSSSGNNFVKSIDISKLASGVYFLKLEGNSSFVKKFVKY